MRRHALVERVAQSQTLDVVKTICGLHAQLMSSAELTLWARVDGLDGDAVSRMLWQERSLLKTWAMRGTLHLLPSEEYPMWQAALGTYRHYLKPAWFRAFGVSREELEQLIAAVAEAVDGRMLTRQELAAEVGRITASAAMAEKLLESWGAMLKPAAFRGHLCFAPNAGHNVRFTGTRSWLGDWSPPDPDASWREVALRFLAANGPATRDDLARWWATTPAQAGKLLSANGEVEQVDVEGDRAWMRAADLEEVAEADPPRSVRLVPAFDQYVVGATRHAAHLLPGDFGPRVYRNQGWLSPVLLVDGRMDGVWRHERKGRALVVEIEPFVSLPKWARRQAEQEAERLAAFLRGDLRLSINAVARPDR